MNVYDHKEIEKIVQTIWLDKKIPERIVKFTGKKKFYLLDGPPYVNGVPHVGHAKTTTFKDIWGRYKQMHGFSVWWQPGFDCGGLPIENAVEKKLGIKSKTEIESSVGVDTFINECKKFAKGNEPIWLDFYKKIGAWRGWLEPYLTSENYYIESGWWTVKKWFEKDLFKEGHRPGFWCPHCETVLAGIEASESYKDVEDPSIYIKFKVKGKHEYLLVWTTTPWTLPANVAVAVHPDETYVKAKVGEEVYIIAEARLEIFEYLGYGYTILETMKGKDLEGLKYEPLLDVPIQHKLLGTNAHQVICSVPIMKKRVASKTLVKGNVSATDEFGHIVTMDTGTGLVHIAPGHGEADNRIGKHYNLPEVSPVDEKGRLTDDAGEFAGHFVKKADPIILEWLQKNGKLFYHHRITHSYPLCWRCKTPLIYRMSKQWFLNIDMLRNKIIKAIGKILWLPEFAGERYLSTISEAPDWAVTRQRYWGIPLPVWTCKCGQRKVIGSVEELRKNSVAKLPIDLDLHKNTVDKIKLKCKCGSEMKREKDVMDVWFDSGIAPWASLGYPFKNKQLFEKLWKVDLVDESQDQIKAWFNTLMICGFATFDEAPYDVVCLNGWTLDEKGEKMSKSLGNVIMAEHAYKELGADLLRLYYCYDIAPWETQKFSLTNAKDLGRSLNILLNTYNYFKTYGKVNENKTTLRIEDKWLLSRLNSLIKIVSEGMDKFEFHTVGRGIVNFIENDFSRTYIKIIRDRDDATVSYVFTTVFDSLLRLMAPITPFITEYIHHDMYKKSVHVQDWPKYNKNVIDEKLEEDVKTLEGIITAVSSIRKEKNIKLKWPLPLLVVDVKINNKDVAEIIKSLCNVKNVRFGKAEDLVKKEFEGGVVYLDTNVIKDEALLREVVRKIQDMRKRTGLVVSDRINVHLGGCDELKKFEKEIKKEVGAKEVSFTAEGGEAIDFEGKKIHVRIEKV
jgi:isoleucyl-tRNA synthetase